ncbi:MAG TPA: DUF4349 domain-containing protein [Bacteroidota bacterium]
MKLLLVILALFLGVSCSTQRIADRYSSTSSQDVLREQTRGSASEQNTTSTLERVIQYSATINMNTDSPDSLFKRILDLTVANEGYMLRTEKERITVRIPTPRFASFLNSLSGYGEVVSKNIEGTDVTEEYFDLTTRLDNAQKTRLRYLELLNRAQTVESALSVERELERLNRDIDLLSGRINKLKHLADFSTITITTAAPVRPGPLGYVFYAAYVAFKWLIVWD